MQERKLKLTWEAIYDVADIADYIEDEFGEARADKFQDDIRIEFEKIARTGITFGNTYIMYRGYSILKKPMPPSIIFYIVKENEVHVLRVLREERDWQKILSQNKGYTYPEN